MKRKKVELKKKNILKVLMFKRWACRPEKHTLNSSSAIADDDDII